MSFSMYARLLPEEQPLPTNFHAVKHVVAEFLGRSGSLRSEPIDIVPPMYGALLNFLRGAHAVAGKEYKAEIKEFMDFIEATPQGFALWIGEEDDY
jgi:hypothetical protein